MEIPPTLKDGIQDSAVLDPIDGKFEGVSITPESQDISGKKLNPVITEIDGFG
jgi:hypothetical protein